LAVFEVNDLSKPLVGCLSAELISLSTWRILGMALGVTAIASVAVRANSQGSLLHFESGSHVQINS